jgi:hypothetical protein
LLGGFSLAAVFGSLVGCLCPHTPGPVTGAHLDLCQSVPPGCRKEVYVFLLNGTDPLRCGNLVGLVDVLHSWGYPKVYYGECYHAAGFAKEALQLHAGNERARFVLMGYDSGATHANQMAQSLVAAQVPVELVVALDGPAASACVPQRLHIVRSGCRATTESVVLTDCACFGVPTHPQTLAQLAEALTTVALVVPPAVEVVVPPVFTSGPVSRPVPTAETTASDAWDFLRPNGHLRMPAR